MNSLYESMRKYLCEDISNANFAKAQSVIKQYFKKYHIYTMPDISKLEVEGVKYYGNFIFNVDSNRGAYFLWKQTTNTSLAGIVFTGNANEVIYNMSNGGRMKGDLEVTIKGASLAAVMPVVKDVLLDKIDMTEKDIDDRLDSYQMYESEDDDLAALRAKKDRSYHRYLYLKKKGEDTSDIEAELDGLKRDIKKATCSFTKRPNVTIAADPVDNAEREFEQRSTPEERFKDMERYINMVLNGIQPSLIISGAPGVGKTYRVTRKIKVNHTLGDDYWVIKGKGTAASLYMDLFKYRHKGDIIVIDDADDVLKDDTCCNILKAATDSSDERIISYGTARPPQMSEEEAAFETDAVADTKGKYYYPKSFTTEASIIIITNMNAGQIDTAVKNRALVCDLEFTTSELLNIVREIVPNIMPESLSTQAKTKALQYLEQMAERGDKMEISIRSFTTVAKIYECCDGEDEDAERMIREQMKLQFARGGKKY